MWYRGSVTIPSNTLASAPVSAVVEVSPGTIQKFYRLFPPGCAGLVSLQVFYQTRQIFPTTPGQSYIGNGSEILGDSSVILDEPEYVLELCGWSPTTSYQHIIYCEFYITEPTIYVPIVQERVFVPVPGLEGVL